MRPSPLLSAAAAAALIAAVAAPALAESPTTAQGVASSSATLVAVAAGGHTVSAGTVELLSDMLGKESVAKILLTPLTADGTAYGQQSVTPDNSPTTSPSVSTSTLVPALNGLVGLSSPVLEASVTNIAGEPTTTAGAASLGSLSVLGLPVALQGSLDVGSAVSRAGGALGEKTVVVEDLALPSVADLLAALGLDLKALPIDVLTELLTALDLVNGAVTDANKALDDAQALLKVQTDAATAEVNKQLAAVDAAQKELTAKTEALAPLEEALLEKNAALTAANSAAADAATALTAAQDDADAAQKTYDAAAAAAAINPLLQPAADLAKVALDEANALVVSAQAAATTTADAATAAKSAADLAQAAVDAAKQAVALASAALDAANRLLDAAQKALADIVAGLKPLIDTLLAAVLAVLDGTPLVSFDSLSVVTEATVTTNEKGGQSAKVLGGEIAGLRVLGTDVLGDVLNTSTVDLLDLTGTQLAAVNGLISDLTGTLSSVLSTVPEFPTLSIPAPEVGLLTKSATTGITDGFGTAATSVKGLSVTLPSVSIPTALALPGAVDLPALDGITQVVGMLTSAPVKIDLATLSSNARFAPGETAAPAAGTPTAGTPNGEVPSTTPQAAVPQLPRTGASSALAVLGAALMAAAFATRRRRTEAADLVA